MYKESCILLIFSKLKVTKLLTIKMRDPLAELNMH